MSEEVVLALVVNPKTFEPCVVVADAEQSSDLDYELYRWDDYQGELTRSGRPRARRPSDARQLRLAARAPGFNNNPTTSRRLIMEGSGYLQYYGTTVDATQLARVHTPRGVVSEGQGFGTVLYTGACLASYFNEKNPGALFDQQTGESGVSSWVQDRSSSASDWWSRAVELGLADEYVNETEDQRYDEVEPSDLAECLPSFDEEEERMADYNDNVHISYTVVVEETFDTLPYENVEEHRLPLVIFDKDIERSGSNEPTSAYLGRLWQAVVDDDGYAVDYFDGDAILALDVRGLPPDAINLLVALLRSQQVEEWKIESFRLRWEMGLDPGSQSRLDAATKAQLRMFANQRDGRAAAEAVEYALELRKEMPWKYLAGLP